MSTGETVVNSYDSGEKPYNHDPKRGKWEGRWDFYCACFANAFGMRTFFMFASFMQMAGEVYIIVPVFLFTLLYIIPVFFIQSFMGQFSSTGFISVFRISPLFKGVGYLILIMNFLSAIYSSSIATFPLLFFLKSFQRNTTWMYCDNEWNTQNCTERMNRSVFYPYNDFNETDSMDPTYEYYYAEVLKFSRDENVFNISWPVILGELFIWTVTCCIVYRGISTVGKYLRYTFIISAVISLILFLRVCFLPEAAEDSAKFFSGESFKRLRSPFTWIVGPFIASAVLGRGWGIILTLASYQPFKAKAERNSYVLPMLLAFVSVVFGYMLRLIDRFINRRSPARPDFYHHESHEYLFIGIPYFFGKIEWSQFWSMLFFSKFLIAEIGLIIIQTFATLTALTDEYNIFRDRKLSLTLGICVLSFAFSILFATEDIAGIIKQLIASGYANGTFVCFLEIIIIAWIYGRERFLRDVRFMLVKNVATWKFYVIRYVTPLFAIVTGLIYLDTALFYAFRMRIIVQCFIFVIKVLPWLIIPGYITTKLLLSIGTMHERFDKCTRPKDWYPADPIDRQKYELEFEGTGLSHQLLEMNDDDDDDGDNVA